jgi:hypothetical protein
MRLSCTDCTTVKTIPMIGRLIACRDHSAHAISVPRNHPEMEAPILFGKNSVNNSNKSNLKTGYKARQQQLNARNINFKMNNSNCEKMGGKNKKEDENRLDNTSIYMNEEDLKTIEDYNEDNYDIERNEYKGEGEWEVVQQKNKINNKPVYPTNIHTNIGNINKDNKNKHQSKTVAKKLTVLKAKSTTMTMKNNADPIKTRVSNIERFYHNPNKIVTKFQMESNITKEKLTDMEISIDIGQEIEEDTEEQNEENEELIVETGKEEKHEKKTKKNEISELKNLIISTTKGKKHEDKKTHENSPTTGDEKEILDETMELVNEYKDEDNEEDDILNDDLDSEASAKLWMTQETGNEKTNENVMDTKPAYILVKKTSNNPENTSGEEEKTRTATQINELSKNYIKEVKGNANNPPKKNQFNSQEVKKNGKSVTEVTDIEVKMSDSSNTEELKCSERDEKVKETKWNIVVTPTSQNTIFQIREILKGVTGVLQSEDEDLLLVTHKKEEGIKQQSININEEIPTTGK